jgi:hypothetical protein
MTTSDTDGCDDACNDDNDGDYTDDDADDDDGDDDTYDRKENGNSMKKAVRKNKMKSSTVTIEGGNAASNPNQPDRTNLRDHYTDAHRLTFHSRFFGKKMRGNEVCKSREEKDIIFDVVKDGMSSRTRTRSEESAPWHSSYFVARKVSI